MENEDKIVPETNTETTENQSVNESSNYSWVEFFIEMANKLGDYKDNHQGMIDIVTSASSELEINNPIEYNGQIIKDMDPFTFFATINRNLNKKKELLEVYKEKLGVSCSVPQKLEGVPQRQNQKLWFTNSEPAFNDNCKSVTDLWELFEAAKLLADNTDKSAENTLRDSFKTAFDKCIADGENVAWGATYGLFWIRPDYFVGLDTNMRNFLRTKKIDIPENHKDLKDGKYLSINDDVKKQIKKLGFKNIYEISHFAYVNRNVTEENINKIFNGGSRQIVLTGAPGTGKTYSAKETAQNDENAKVIKTAKGEDGNDIDIKHEFVQFHPSFDYTDFVEGLRPVQVQIGGKTETTFVRMDGIFKAFCRKAAYDEINHSGEDNYKTRFYFIIDEINRADLSKVFGELMYCLEYRGVEGKVRTQYNNLDTYIMTSKGVKTFNEIKEYNEQQTDEKNKIDTGFGDKDVFEDGFYIPQNVYIIGTMNDIDRSVESFDFALRRRFKWIEIKVKDVEENILKGIFKDEARCEDIVNFLKPHLEDLNNYISLGSDMGLSEAYQIGPAYFKEFGNIKDGVYYQTKISQIYKNEIETTLKEYVRGRDQGSINKFLKDACTAFGLTEDYKWLERKRKEPRKKGETLVESETIDEKIE